MFPAVRAEMVRNLRSTLHYVSAALVLAVERAQRVDFGARHARLTQLIGMLVHIGADELSIGGTALLAPHRVDEQVHRFARDADCLVEAHEHDDGLSVDRRLLGAQALNAHLVKLALTSLLRTLRAEHGARIHQFRRRTALGNEVMLSHRAHDAGSAFGTKRQAAFALDGTAVDEAFQVLARHGSEHLLGHNVGRFANAADEQIGLLEYRCLDGHIPVTGENGERRLLKMQPKRRLVR